MRVILSIFVFGFIGCGGPSSPVPPATPATTAPAGMSKYAYLAADGGPHMLLPAEASALWTGASSMAAVVNPKSDYGRACAATVNAQMAVIPVGATSALVFSDPPMTAWGTSTDGLVEIYYLDAWTNTNLDALVAKATASLTTASMTDSGTVFQLNEPDAYLLYAGDTPTSTAYGVHRVTIPAGKYKVMTGTYTAKGESVTVYRLKPAGT